MSGVSRSLERRVPPWPVWAASLGLWAFLSAIATWSNLQNALRAGQDATLGREVLHVLVGTIPWAISMPLIVWFSARHPVDGDRRWRRVGTILGVCLVWLVIAALLVSLPRSVVAGRSYLDQLRLHIDSGKAAFAFEYTTLILYAALGQAIGFWDRGQRRESERAELERQMVEARLANLRMKVEPHFIFNALNTVAALVRRGEPQAAVKAVIGLSDLMREALHTDAPTTHGLLDELELVGRYLEIEHLRYRERMSVAVEIAPSLRDLSVPVLLLQPLVENAVRHGVGGTQEPVTIRIRAWVEQSMVHLQVANDGPPLPPHFSMETAGGLGLALTRRRIALSSPGAAVSIASLERGVATTITLAVVAAR